MEFPDKTVRAFLKSRGRVTAKDWSCADPRDKEGAGPVGQAPALQPDSPELAPCAGDPEAVRDGGRLCSPVPLVLALIFPVDFCLFPQTRNVLVCPLL